MTLSGAQEPWRVPPPRRVTVSGGRLAAFEIGSGPPVLCLHGISADHTEWAAVGRRLADDFRVLLPDLLGRGVSEPDASCSFTLAEERDRLVELLDALEVERPLVAGHSHGASLALSLAARRPVAGILLASPVTPWTPRPAVLGLLRSAAVRHAVQPLLRTCRRPLTRYILSRRVYGEHAPHVGDAVDRYAAPYADRARALALLRVFRDWDPRALADVEVPTGVAVHVVTGAADRRIDPAHARRWAERLGARYTLVEAAGHGLTEEAPARVETILRGLAESTGT